MAKTTKELYAAFLGEKNAHYYLGQFLSFDEAGGRLTASWNWAALFLCSIWMAYRKMYGLAAFTFFAWAVMWSVSTSLSNAGSPTLAVLAILPALAIPIYANSLYHQHVMMKIKSVTRVFDDEETISRLRNIGGVNSIAAWSIGLLPSVGIVAAVAIPVMSGTNNPPLKQQSEATRTPDTQAAKNLPYPQAQQIEAAAEQARINEAVRIAIERYPYLDVQSSIRNEAAIAEVVRVRDQLIQAGTPTHQAILQAADSVAKTIQ